MINFKDKSFLQSSIDMAALNPYLQPDAADNYFRDCQRLRNSIKTHLQDKMEIEHNLYLTSNATAGLMTTIAGLSLDGMSLDMEAELYSNYSSLRRPNKNRSVQSNIELITHVNPVTGCITPPNKTCVLDASQSFGTICHHREALHADIVISGLQKHAGIATGLGIIAIRKDVKFSGIHQAAEVAEQGTVSKFALETALTRCSKPNAPFFNSLVLNVSPELTTLLSAQNIDVLTPFGSNLPFVCLKGKFPKDINMHCAKQGLSAKYFSDIRILRISGYVAGKLDSPISDHSKTLSGLLKYILTKQCHND